VQCQVRPRNLSVTPRIISGHDPSYCTELTCKSRANKRPSGIRAMEAAPENEKAKVMYEASLMLGPGGGGGLKRTTFCTHKRRLRETGKGIARLGLLHNQRCVLTEQASSCTHANLRIHLCDAAWGPARGFSLMGSRRSWEHFGEWESQWNGPLYLRFAPPTPFARLIVTSRSRAA